MGLLRVTCPLLVLLAAAGCGEDGQDASDPGDDRREAMRASCVALATTWCDLRARCLATSFRAEYGGKETCIERQTTRCERARFGQGSSATPEQVTACAAASDLSREDLDAACATWLQREVARVLPSECTPTGNLADEQRCLTGDQCLSRSCLPAVPCGRCGKLGKLGDRCFEDGDCASDTACAGQRCTLYGGLGASCDPLKPCRPELGCGQDGRCGVRLEDGEPCDPRTAPCALWPVELACSPVRRICEPIELVGAYQHCPTLEDGSVAQCEYGLACGYEAGADLLAPRSCTPRLDDDAYCSALGFATPTGPCQPPAICSLGRCQIVDAAQCSAVLP
jgi:hypothetical protein